jgi:hypothetical protein
MLIPRDGSKASRAAFVVCTVLRKNPTDATRRRVDAHVDRTVRSIVNGDEGRQMDNGVFETLHGVVMFLSPGKGLPFTGKVD